MEPQIERCPTLISNCRTPKILWRQTDNAIFIEVVLTDVETYYLKVTSDTFQFSTVLNGQRYFMGIRLFGSVVAEKTSHEKLGREIKICMIKAHKWVDWPRLQLSRDKNSFICVNPNYIVKKSWDDPHATLKERESFDEYKRRMNITNIPPPESSTSGSDSDDERLIGYD